MIRGSIVALVTPMADDGSVSWSELAALIDFHLTAGTHAIVSMGTTGESATLDFDEHIEVVRRTVERVQGRIPVVAGTGANSTREAIELTAAAKQAGADACLLVTPYYNKPTQQGLYLHYKAIAEQVEIPQILYNVPGRTACDLLPETVARLAQLPNIIGIKEATGSVERAKEILACCPAPFMLYCGDDAIAIELILLGAQGNISVTANVAPRQMAEACAAALAGDAARARQIDLTLAHLHRDLFIESNPIPVKWALHEMGLISTGIRLPLTPLSPQHRLPLRQALQQAELLGRTG